MNKIKYPNFDINFYINFNYDLLKIKDIFNHYDTIGKKEERIISLESFKKYNPQFNYYYFLKKFEHFLNSYWSNNINVLNICLTYCFFRKLWKNDFIGLINLKKYNNFCIFYRNYYTNLFDYKYYFNKYDDLGINSLTSVNQLLNHWLKNGIKEDRIASLKYIETKIDYEYYLEKYYDLKENGINNNKLAFQHYINHGEKEKREINYYEKIKDFDIDFYKLYYKDLSEKDNLSIIKHYIYNSKNEIRLKNINEFIDYMNFNWEFYKNNYQDLKDLKNERECVLHYLEYGIHNNKNLKNNFFYNNLDKITIKNQKLINKNNVKIGVVITTYSYYGVFVRQCIECFIRELPKNSFIVLYINESNDPITMNLKKKFNNITIINIEDQTSNGGLTATWNDGIFLCQKNNCDIIILSNDDILFNNSINNIIWECYKNKNELKYFGPLTNKPGPKNCIYNKFQLGKKPVNNLSFIPEFDNKICNLNGFFMVFSKYVLNKNKFNEKYFFNPEFPFEKNEVEWFNRFKNIGGVPIIVPTTFIYHYKIARWRNNLKLNDICVYTVNLGNYEGDKIYIKDIGFDNLYFTDNFNLIYKCIEKNIIPFYIKKKKYAQQLLQREIKTSPHLYLPHNYNKSIYIDGNVIFKTDININNYIIDEYDIICFEHPTRNNVYDEINKVIELKLETKENTNKILEKFKKSNFKDDYGLTETNILIRNHKNLTNFNNDWTKCIKKCIRDQISFDYLLFKHNIKFFKFTHKDKLNIMTKEKHINPKNRILNI